MGRLKRAYGAFCVLAALPQHRVKLSVMDTTPSINPLQQAEGQAGAWAELNPRQQRFVLAILEGKTREAATHEAGYKNKNYGRRLVAYCTKVNEAIAQGQREIGERAGITQDFLVEQTLTILEYALTPVQSKDRYGKPTGPEMRQLGAANTAIFNLAKLCGFWVDKRADAPPNLAAELFEAIGARPMKLIEHDPDDEAKE